MIDRKRIRIAFLWQYYRCPMTSVDDLVIGFDKNQYEVIFIYLSEKDAPPNHLSEQGFKVEYLTKHSAPRYFNLFLVFKLFRILKQNKIDILHCHAHKATVYGVLASILARTPRVCAHIHGLNRSRTWRRRFVNFLILRKVDMILSVADAVRRDFLKANPSVSPNKVKTLENSIDITRFIHNDIKNTAAKSRLQLPANGFIIGTAGRLTANKGHKYLIDAFLKVQKALSQAHLIIAGDGPLRNELAKQINKLGLDNAVHLLGRRNDIELVYKAMDVFVLPSVGSEGMPRVILEAMAASVPCIVTDVGGNAEIISNGEYGIVVPPRDIEALKDAILRIAQMTNTAREKILSSAKARIEEDFSHDVARERLKCLYKEMFHPQFL